MNLKLKIVGIPVSSVCNFHCSHCLRVKRDDYARNSYFMSCEQAAVVAGKIRGYTKYVNLSAGYGEPYLNPNFSSIAEIFKENDLITIVYTNASAETRNSIVNSKVGMLLLSIDDYHFPLNRSCVEQLLEAFYSGQRFADAVRLNVVLDANKEESYMLRYVNDLCNTYPELIAECHWKNDYKNVEGQLGRLPAYYDMSSFCDRLILPTKNFSYHNKCTDIFDALYFDEFGNLRSCCIFMESTASLNIYKNDIPEILSSSYLRGKRAFFSENNGFEFCSSCPIGHGYIW